MRRKRRHGSRGLQSEINVVPYLDVMLVLLVIFMVTAPLITQSVIDLPSSGDTATGQRANALEVLMPESGGYTVRDYNFAGAEAVFANLPGLVDHLAERRVLFPGAPILIAADRDLPYWQIVEVLGALHVAGLANFGLVAAAGK